MAYPPPPYADPICGTFVCGEAICGQWWAYPTASKLTFGAIVPDDAIVIVGEQVPIAGLRLGTYLPTLIVDTAVAVPQAGLRLGAIAPTILISQSISVSQAGLHMGAIIPVLVGRVYLSEAECYDLVLGVSAEQDLVLVGAVASDLVLEPEECL